MRKKSGIASELVKAGFLKGSKEYNAEYKRRYQRMRRLDPKVQEQERLKWLEYYRSKPKSWSSERLKLWRKQNPSKWKALMLRASEAGLHKRFYEKHKEVLRKVKAANGRAKRRQDPTFGLWARINEIKRTGDIRELAKECLDAITRLDELSRKRRSKSEDR